MSERRLGALLRALAAVAVVTGACGGGTRTGDTATTIGPATTTSTTAALPKSAPRWETVTTLSGTGAQTTDPFSILPGAIQWRARWSCQSGHLTVRTDPPPRRGEPMVDADCGAKPAGTDGNVGYSIVTGKVKLVVDAAGPWQLTVDQQIDTPLMEPPLPAMGGATVLGKGDFYDVEMKGSGHATLYKLADGSLAVRLEDFQVSNNTDLFLWASEASHPKNSAEASGTPYVSLGNLKSTFGSENYVLPAGLTADKVKSLVVWCQPVRVAYAAVAFGAPS